MAKSRFSSIAIVSAFHTIFKLSTLFESRSLFRHPFAMWHKMPIQEGNKQHLRWDKTLSKCDARKKKEKTRRVNFALIILISVRHRSYRTQFASLSCRSLFSIWRKRRKIIRGVREIRSPRDYFTATVRPEWKSLSRWSAQKSALHYHRQLVSFVLWPLAFQRNSFLPRFFALCSENFIKHKI